MRTPTQRSLAFLRQRGFIVHVVEHYNAYAHVRRDLFGFIDIVAIHPELPGVMGVQTTTGANLSAREHKARALDAYHAWLKAGNTVEFHGWRKIGARGKQKTWKPIIRQVRQQDDVEKLL